MEFGWFAGSTGLFHLNKIWSPSLQVAFCFCETDKSAGETNRGHHLGCSGAVKFSRVQLNTLEKMNATGASVILCLILQLRGKPQIHNLLFKKVLFWCCLLSLESIATHRCRYILFMYTFSTGEAPDRPECPLFTHRHTQSPWQKWRKRSNPRSKAWTVWSAQRNWWCWAWLLWQNEGWEIFASNPIPFEGRIRIMEPGGVG